VLSFRLINCGLRTPENCEKTEEKYIAVIWCIRNDQETVIAVHLHDHVRLYMLATTHVHFGSLPPPLLLFSPKFPLFMRLTPLTPTTTLPTVFPILTEMLITFTCVLRKSLHRSQQSFSTSQQTSATLRVYITSLYAPWILLLKTLTSVWIAKSTF
jgi:hypothetical protein